MDKQIEGSVKQVDCWGNQSEGDYYDKGAQAQDRRFI